MASSDVIVADASEVWIGPDGRFAVMAPQPGSSQQVLLLGEHGVIKETVLLPQGRYTPPVATAASDDSAVQLPRDRLSGRSISSSSSSEGGGTTLQDAIDAVEAADAEELRRSSASSRVARQRHGVATASAPVMNRSSSDTMAVLQDAQAHALVMDAGVTLPLTAREARSSAVEVAAPTAAHEQHLMWTHNAGLRTSLPSSLADTFLPMMESPRVKGDEDSDTQVSSSRRGGAESHTPTLTSSQPAPGLLAMLRQRGSLDGSTPPLPAAGRTASPSTQQGRPFTPSSASVSSSIGRFSDPVTQSLADQLAALEAQRARLMMRASPAHATLMEAVRPAPSPRREEGDVDVSREQDLTFEQQDDGSVAASVIVHPHVDMAAAIAFEQDRLVALSSTGKSPGSASGAAAAERRSSVFDVLPQPVSDELEPPSQPSHARSSSVQASDHHSYVQSEQASSGHPSHIQRGTSGVSMEAGTQTALDAATQTDQVAATGVAQRIVSRPPPVTLPPVAPPAPAAVTVTSAPSYDADPVWRDSVSKLRWAFDPPLPASARDPVAAAVSSVDAPMRMDELVSRPAASSRQQPEPPAQPPPSALRRLDVSLSTGLNASVYASRAVPPVWPQRAYESGPLHRHMDVSQQPYYPHTHAGQSAGAPAAGVSSGSLTLGRASAVGDVLRQREAAAAARTRAAWAPKAIAAEFDTADVHTLIHAAAMVSHSEYVPPVRAAPTGPPASSRGSFSSRTQEDSVLAYGFRSPIVKAHAAAAASYRPRDW